MAGRRGILGFLVIVMAAGVPACGGHEDEIDFSQPLSDRGGKGAASSPGEVAPGTAAQGWSAKAPAERYGPETLFDYMNGGAERYLSRGFEEMTSTFYGPTAKNSACARGDEEIVVELYRFQTTEQARSLMNMEAGEGFAPISLGDAGAMGTQSAAFCRGRIYVKLIGYEASECVRKGLMELAQAMDEVVAKGGENGRP